MKEAWGAVHERELEDFDSSTSAMKMLWLLAGKILCTHITIRCTTTFSLQAWRSIRDEPQ